MKEKYRKILHIDLDAFFASVEQRDFPALRGKPIAVGLNHSRGVVAAASYEARKFGIHSAQPTSQAAKLCPNLVFVPGRMDVYKAVSAEIFQIFYEYTDLVEPVSIDEAFLDVTHNFKSYELGVDVAKEIKARITEKTGLIASAGVSYNKFLAKIASDWRKPNGLCVIHPSQALSFIDKLPVKAIWGIGPVTTEKMQKLGIHTGKELREKDLSFLVHHFGKAGYSYYAYARGIDDRPVTTSRLRKQVGMETTFDSDISDKTILAQELETIANSLEARLQRHGFKGTSITLKVRFHSFQTVTRTHSGDTPLYKGADIAKAAKQLLLELELNGQSVRLIGISIGNRIVEDERDLYLPFDEFSGN